MNALTEAMPSNYNALSGGFGKRKDGTEKGYGYFGIIDRPSVNGKKDFSTELSIGVNLGGKEMEIPLMVPTLSAQELDHLINGGQPTEQHIQKAVEFARDRLRGSQSPYANMGEQYRIPTDYLR